MRSPFLSAKTGVVGIFGDPVGHSRSPVMQNAAFAALKLDLVYVAFRVNPDELHGAVSAIRSLNMRGVNVTVPHKEAVIPFLDTVSPTARAVGAVNTIVHTDGRLHGHNTDVSGFVGSLAVLRSKLRGKHVIVVGAGGAARSVISGLVQLGTARISIANRTPDKASDLARRFASAKTRTEAVALPSLAKPEMVRMASLVVNTTSLGWGDAAFPPLVYSATPPECVFYDLVYGNETEFLQHASCAGRRTLDGLEMLVLQGAEAFRLWTRRRPPIDIMRTSLIDSSREVTRRGVPLARPPGRDKK